MYNYYSFRFPSSSSSSSFSTLITMSSPVVETARAARLASVSLQSVTNEQKNQALLKIKQVLGERREEIFKANEQDKKIAEDLVKQGKLSSSLFKRLDVCQGDKFDTIFTDNSIFVEQWYYTSNTIYNC